MLSNELSNESLDYVPRYEVLVQLGLTRLSSSKNSSDTLNDTLMTTIRSNDGRINGFAGMPAFQRSGYEKR